MNKKLHSRDAGCVAERTNPFCPGHKVVIYRADAQGFDVDGNTYAVVCDLHATLCGTNSVKDARVLMKWPNNFCEGCQAAYDGNLELAKRILEES